MRFAPCAWAVLVFALGCSTDERDAASTPSDVPAACFGACQQQAGCSPPVPSVDCTAVCALQAPAADAGFGCDVTAQLARYDQCGLLECSHVGSCIMSVRASCQGGFGGAAGGAPGTGGLATGGIGPVTGGAGGAGGLIGGAGGAAAGAGGTAGASGGTSAVCAACGGKSNACCVALAARLGQDAAQCADTTQAKCLAAPATEQASFADQCTLQLQTGASLGVTQCQ